MKISMTRILVTPLFSLSRAQVPATSFFRNLYGPHGRSVNQMGDSKQDHVKMPSISDSVSGSSASCSIGDLSTKKCVPCNAKDLRPMTEQSASDLLQKVAGWDMANDNGTLKLHRSWKVKSFTKGIDFFKRVADVAETEGHHPDLHLVGWNNIKIEIWTHAVGGLTENDFILAAKISELDVQDLLRRKKSSQ